MQVKLPTANSRQVLDLCFQTAKCLVGKRVKYKAQVKSSLQQWKAPGGPTSNSLINYYIENGTLRQMGKSSLQQWVNKGPKVSALGAAYGSVHEGSVGGVKKD